MGEGRALFVPSVPDALWAPAVLPGVNPLETAVAGRQFIDYVLEAAKRFGITAAHVIDWLYTSRLEDRFAEKRDGSVAVEYHRGHGPVPLGLADLPREFGDVGPVVWGLCLPFYEPSEARYEPVPDEETHRTPTGIYRRDGARWLRASAAVFALRDFATWLGLTMELLSGGGSYTLPGYSAEKGVSLCRNVVMEYGTMARPPVLLLDNVWCERNVRLENGVVLGRNVFVGEGTRLSRTMVCDDTFLGAGLNLVGKIVVGRRIIDAVSGTWVDIEEEGIAHRIQRSPNWLDSVFRFLAGRSFGRRR